MKRIGTITLFLWSVFALFSGLNPAQAQGAVTFGETQIENNFPNNWVFQVEATSSGEEIVKAELLYGGLNQISSMSWTSELVEFEPGTEVNLEVERDTADITVPPSMPVAYYWRVTDADGNRLESERQVFRYDDLRFDWKIEENDAIAVWWHQKPDNFGTRVFEIASRALAEQRDLFQVDLDYQIRIIIYNDFEEFDEWHATRVDWVGGEAFSNYGITTQIVYGSFIDESWLNDVVPHEISHLYFAKVTYNPTTNIPYWLNEGVAQYNEFGSHRGSVDLAESAAAKDELVQLSALAYGFGRFDEDRVRLAYAESVSAVIYMVEAFGNDGVADLLAAYRNGSSTEEAFEKAFGQSVGEFEAGWAAWLGVPEGAYVTPTSWGFPTFPPSPTFGSSGSGSGGETKTPEPIKEETATPVPLAQTDSSTTGSPDDGAGNGGQLNCLPSFALLVGGIAVAGSRRGRKKNRI